MRTVINKDNLETLIRGASIFTTGGGIPVSDQLVSLADKNINVEVWSLDEFNKNSYLCTVGELGPTDVPPLAKEKIVKKMLKLLEKNAGKKIAGLFPPEIGQESVVLECAHYLKLPIADFDPSGFRAVPHFDMNVFNVKKMDFQLTPIVVTTDTFKLFVIEEEMKYKNVEAKLREMTSLSNNGVVFLMGEIISVKALLKNKITSPSYTKALKFGSIPTPNKLLKILKPKRIIHGKVVNKTKLKQKGFLAEKVTIKDSLWNLYTLIVLNEAIFLVDVNGEILESVPDRILLIEPEKVMGISGVFLNKNTPVTIAVIGPENEWKSKRAGKVFGKNRFKSLLK